ncbi:uncharacterized protein LOC119670885 [Teleopsis dalmanni]|uniref:uncharacterized protein LOC119670885 n=1 Tax=Teleopsis dalmanni TaxID=139649 RepID=UPI0018CECC3C|nr:uncharacterized protein LOC119670885 [Teleopsis dalmanni]XP_037937249.1 uncharacterized protein LOC119670885 [Teleopsis dalmanni]
MVKILQAYNFAKQNTFSLNGEILAASLIDSNRIAISSAEQFIEIYDIGGKQRFTDIIISENEVKSAILNNSDASADERVPTKYSLPTVGEVVNLIYCAAGNYLLTLEKENVSSPVHSNSTSISCTSSSNSATVFSEEDTKMFVRIYANFLKFAEEKLIDMPITIRIASMTTPKAPLVESIDVIELPLRSPPDLIQCCQTSGNIIVTSKERIYLYEYTKCTHESTQPRFSYIDFLPFKFFVNLNFAPLKINLAENVIACMNNRYCVAFKVVDVLGNSTNSSQPAENDFGVYEAGDIDADEAISTSESSTVSKASAAPSSHNSFETDSLETTSSGRIAGGTSGFPGRTPVDFNVARIVNSACGREFEVDIKSQWEQGETLSGGGSSIGIHDTQEIIIMPMRASDIKIKLVNEAKAMNVQRMSAHGNISACTDDNAVQYDIRKLLQICMKTTEPNSRIVDILRCIDLKAIYQRNPNAKDEPEDSEYEMGNQQVPSAVTTSKHINRRTLKSHIHQSCIGYALMVASSVDGYLYQFCAQGKWYNENEKPIATYSFTAPVLKVHINDYVIYAITNESVETHTSRVGHKLFNNRFEYPTISGLFPEESSPDVNAAITVVGLCSFMHVQFVCVNHDNMVLISNSSFNGSDISNAAKRRSGGGEVKRNIAARLIAEAKAKNILRSSSSSQPTAAINEWTLYNLEIPQVEYVVEDLETIAESYRSASSSNFYDLMEEAHVMLRLSLSLKYEQLNVEREQNLRAKFVDNCRKLADFSIRSHKKEVYLQATGFYKMCNLQLTEIYANYINNFGLENSDSDKVHSAIENASANQDQFIGLLYTVKLFLLSLGTDRLNAAFLNQLVKPYFSTQKLAEKGYSQVPLSLEFLNMFIKYSQNDIPQIMLRSPVVADAISGELINYLKYINNLNPEENLLLAVTACRMSNYILAKEIISKTNRRELAIALIKYKNVLFDDSTVLYQKQRSDNKYQNGTRSNGCTHKQTQSHRQQKRKSSSGYTYNSIAQTNNVVSFSDFTETILLATEDLHLIEAISDAFIHALCIEHSITLDVILQLFLNYIASHIGHKGYQTSQKVFVNILQVYYYDLFDVNPLNNPPEPHSHTPVHNDDIDEVSSKAASLNSERDNESLANSLGESISGASSSAEERLTPNKHNRIVYDQLQEHQSPYKHCSSSSLNNAEEAHLSADDIKINLKGLKILFRMYLGRLKALSDLMTELQSADMEQEAQNEDFLNLRMECIKFMMRHLQEMRAQHEQQSRLNIEKSQYFYGKANMNSSTANANFSNNEKKFIFVPYIPDYKLPPGEFATHVKFYIRPIPCLLERPQYLNRLPPFKRTDFSFPNKDDGEFEVRFLGWQNELLTLTLKIQSLLAFSKIDREIIEEFIAFIQKTPNLIGIDSFLVIILPKNLAINYMLNFCPEYLWQYGKSNGFSPKHWENLLRKILGKQDLLPNWKEHITEILNNLVAELSFEELLQCFPSEVIQSHSTGTAFKENSLKESHIGADAAVDDTASKTKILRNHFPMDNIDENNVFELTLRKAVSKQRSIALRSMIETTGTQLFDATSNPMYNI